MMLMGIADMKTARLNLLLLVVAAIGSCTVPSDEVPLGTSFVVSFSPGVLDESSDGRLILILTKNDDEEPRFQVRPGVNAVQIFGVNVEGMHPGETILLDQNAFGYPNASLTDLPEGEYFVQALLHKYDTFNLSNGKTVKLPMDRGEGQ